MATWVFMVWPVTCCARFIKFLQQSRYVQPHDKVYCLLNLPLRMSVRDFIAVLEFVEPPHLLFITYAQKAAFGTPSKEYAVIDNITTRFRGRCIGQTRMATDMLLDGHAQPHTLAIPTPPPLAMRGCTHRWPFPHRFGWPYMATHTACHPTSQQLAMRGHTYRCFLKADIGCYVYSTVQDTNEEPASIILARGVRAPTLPVPRGTMTNPMMLMADGQDRTFLMSKHNCLPNAYGWCFGGPDGLGLSQTSDKPVMRWKAYAPLKHLWNQFALRSSAGKRAIPQVHFNPVCRTSLASHGLLTTYGHAAFGLSACGSMWPRVATMLWQDSKASSDCLKRLAKLQQAATSVQGAAYLAQGLRLEVTVAALSLAEAFNLAVHKMRHLLAYELEIIAVPNEHYAEISSEALQLCRRRVSSKHVKKGLSVQEVRLHAMSPCHICCCTTHPALPSLATRVYAHR